MRKFISIMLIVATVMLIASCGSRSKVPEGWYQDTLDYYAEGFRTNWANEKRELHDPVIGTDLKDPRNKFGYLLIDLDGDGGEELLIGIMDNDAHTKFTDVYIWHSDLGAFQIMSKSEGYYAYLCNGNVLRVDSWYGSQTETQYMAYNSDNNSFTILNDTKYIPMKIELTEFQ